MDTNRRPVVVESYAPSGAEKANAWCSEEDGRRREKVMSIRREMEADVMWPYHWTQRID